MIEKKSFWTKEVSDGRYTETVPNVWNIIKFSISTIGMIIVLFVINPISCIAPAERGIEVVGGKPKNEILQPGINFHTPVIGKIQKYSIEPRTYDLLIDIRNRGAVSKDNQIIGAEGKIVWSFDPEKIDVIVKNYPRIESIEQIIKNTSYEALKTVIGKYTIYDLPGSMAQIGTESSNNLKLKMSGYPIIVSQFNVTNFDWSEDFDKRINDTMAAQQKVREMEQQAAITEQQSKQQVIQAEAGARAAIAKAEGDLASAELNAKAKIAEAQGLAESNRIKQQYQAYEIRMKELDIQLTEAKAWNGKRVPDYVPLNPAGGIVTLPGSK